MGSYIYVKILLKYELLETIRNLLKGRTIMRHLYFIIICSIVVLNSCTETPNNAITELKPAIIKFNTTTDIITFTDIDGNLFSAYYKSPISDTLEVGATLQANFTTLVIEDKQTGDIDSNTVIAHCSDTLYEAYRTNAGFKVYAPISFVPKDKQPFYYFDGILTSLLMNESIEGKEYLSIIIADEKLSTGNRTARKYVNGIGLYQIGKIVNDDFSTFQALQWRK